MRLKIAATPSGAGTVTGYHVLAFLMSLIEKANPTLADSLHRDDGLKPFTLSPLNPPGRNRCPLLQKEMIISFRITLLKEEIFTSLADAVWRLSPETVLSLGEVLVQCERLDTTPDQSLWADSSSFSRLLQNAGRERKLRLAFLSPTTFRSRGERNILFPETSLVFGSLLARWNAYAPDSLKLSLGKNEIGLIRLSGYRLSTHMLDFGGYQELGFYGRATYEAGSQLPENQMIALNALADFAFFAGVGAKTTMGMGQCRRLDNARALSHRTGSHSEERGGCAPGDQRGTGTAEDTCHQG